MRFALPRDVPVVPDADTARRWAADELADPVYHAGQSLLDRIIAWVMELIARIFAGGQGTGADPRLVGLVMLVVIVTVALVALWIAGPVRRSARGKKDRIVFDAADARTADQMRAASVTSAERLDWHGAVLDRFRAIVRSLEERTLLEERAGRTAHEVAVDAAATLPDHRPGLLDAGQIFDEVCYGDADGSEPEYRSLVELDEAILATRPRRTRSADDGVSGDDALARAGWSPAGGER